MLIPKSPNEISHERVVILLQHSTKALEAIRQIIANTVSISTEENWYLQETFDNLGSAVYDLEQALFKDWR